MASSNKITTTLKNNDRQNKIKSMRESVKKNKTIWVTKPTKPFDSDFIKLKQLGNAGQYGITYQCRNKSTNEIVAVKEINKNRFYRIDPKYRHRYLRAMCDEIDVLKTLNHKYIIEMKNVYEDKTTLYIVMEECKGGELFNRICKKGKYNEKSAAKIIKQLLKALRYMHEDNNICHCDLKPNNILFLTEKEDSPIKIIDFGMSKVLPRLKYLTHLCGTPYFTAPEVIQKKKYNHSADMWSVGVILFMMIYGYPPFWVDTKKYGKGERDEIYRQILKGFIPKVKDTSKYGLGAWFPDHIKTSNSVKDLISKLLQSKVRKRYTAREALTHPWIINETNNNNDLDKHIISRLIGFNNLCQFKQVIAKIFRNQFYKMRPEHFHQLEALFIKFDTDKDGILSYSEFELAIKNIKDININDKQLENIYKQLNSSSQSNIGIQFADLLNALVFDYLIACDERLYDAFRKLDTDNDGKITTKQLKEKLKQIDPLGETDKAIQIIEQQLLDKNGVIDYEQFLLNLHPNFEEKPEWMPDLFKQMSSVANGTSVKFQSKMKKMKRSSKKVRDYSNSKINNQLKI